MLIYSLNYYLKINTSYYLSMDYSLSDLVTGERLQELCDVYCGAELANIKNPRTMADTTKHINLTALNSAWNNPKIVYCYGDALSVFCKKVQFFKNPFVLVTHNSDINITDVFSVLLNDKKILAMYSQNVCYNHPKLKCLPIGLANSQWEQGDLLRLYIAILAKPLKTNDVYFQFSMNTNISRNMCKVELEKKGLIFMSPTPFTEYINILASYKFAICPEGNGIDSHRIWECYYMDVIPIVLSTVFTKKIREMLPCILLDSWSDFNLNSCLSQYDALIRELHTKRKYLQLSYYNESIRSHMMTLAAIVDNTRTDKNTTHTYLDLYEQLLHGKRESARTVLEVGIGDGNQGATNGGSIKLWNDYFRNATVYALDIQSLDCVWDGLKGNPRIVLYTSSDAYDENFVKTTFVNKGIKFDFMLDDGPHSLESMFQFITLYSPLMKDDGILIIEDVQSWDWIQPMVECVPQELKKYIEVYDLRPLRGRYDDIVFVINKSH